MIQQKTTVSDLKPITSYPELGNPVVGHHVTPSGRGFGRSNAKCHTAPRLLLLV